MLFTLLLFGFDFLSAAGNAKVLNFASNCGALLFFMILGQVNYFYGIIMASSMMIGALLGAQFALKKRGRICKSFIFSGYCNINYKNLYDFIVQ